MSRRQSKLPADYVDAAAKIYEKSIPLKERLDRILSNAAKDGHDRNALDGEAFDEATRRITAATLPAGEKPKGIEGTPMGAFLEETG